VPPSLRSVCVCARKTMAKNKRKNFYAVAIGRTPGIYLTWEQCEPQVKGFRGAQYKGFEVKSQAEYFINSFGSGSGSGEGKARSSGATSSAEGGLNRKEGAAQTAKGRPKQEVDGKPMARKPYDTMSTALDDLLLTAEQQAILDTLPSASSTSSTTGQLTRIKAAAGAGKTSTLLALALKAVVQKGYRHVTYLTFTNAAAADGAQRLSATLLAHGNNIEFDARTLHSCAKRELNSNRKNDDEASSSSSPIWTDKKIKAWISHECHQDVEDFLRSCERELSKRSRGRETTSNRRRAKEQVEFYLYKSLVHFCQSSWTYQEYTTGNYQSGPRRGNSIFGVEYYPITLFHKQGGDGEGLGFLPRDYFQNVPFYRHQAARLWACIVKDDIPCFDFEMKRAQLEHLRIPGTLLLVDESQDMDACQIDWVAGQQIAYGTHVYVVGDPAQAIYGFRGAKPRYLLELKAPNDCTLTESWRFGHAISQIANLVLYAKHNSPQTAMTPYGKHKNWIPYRTRPGAPKEGVVTEDSILMTWKTHPVTVIARANAELLLVALDAIGYVVSEPTDEGESKVVSEPTDEGESKEEVNPESSNTSLSGLGVWNHDAEEVLPKIHMNGKGESSGIKLWRRTLKLIQDVYNIYANESDSQKLDAQQFPEFAGKTVSWSSFCDEVDKRELNKYTNAVNVVNKLRHNTLQAMGEFEKHVLENKYSAQEADIILTTCHSAKGMEWDHVQICNDFIRLDQFKCTPGQSDKRKLLPPLKRCRTEKSSSSAWEFAFKEYGDDVNMSYVACTRAKKLLSLPSCFVTVLKLFDAIHSWKCMQEDSKAKVNSIGFYICGRKEPLSDEQANDLHAQLILPLRKEFGVEGNVSICDQYIHSDRPIEDCSGTEEPSLRSVDGGPSASSDKKEPKQPSQLFKREKADDSTDPHAAGASADCAIEISDKKEPKQPSQLFKREKADDSTDLHAAGASADCAIEILE
jgi:superfamily I DNA/RNA helicase